MSNNNKILDHLIFLYGKKIGVRTFNQLQKKLDFFSARINELTISGLSERDSILITYGDQIQQPGEMPLQTMAKFYFNHLLGLISGIHILPFYPYSSDDGFSVIDYRAVNPGLGSWEDIALLGSNFRLMFDAVINHISVESNWFQGYLEGDQRYKDYFIEVEENPSLSNVVRPRISPLLTHFSTSSGNKAIWTTFSPDQVDLNYQNSEVLLEILDLLLFYVAQGAEFLRLDAIAYLWKEIGTACIHLPQTHSIIQIMRAMLEEVAPHVILITETNVPHEENISYFGDGSNEAHLVYNFTLPPLVLYTLQEGNAGALSTWASKLSSPSNQVTFLNFLASHDGIGVTPLRAILPESAIAKLVNRTLALGGLVSYRTNPDGGHSPYELNINYFDALCDPDANESLKIKIARFSAAHAIAFSIMGLPAIYFHSLFGSTGWLDGVKKTGQNRTINRQKLLLAEIESELADPGSKRFGVFNNLRKLLKARASSPAFHPYGDQLVIECGQSIFAIVRYSPDHRQKVLCLQNVSNKSQVARIDQEEKIHIYRNRHYFDLIKRKHVTLEQKDTINLEPYQTLWLDISC